MRYLSTPRGGPRARGRLPPARDSQAVARHRMAVVAGERVPIFEREPELLEGLGEQAKAKAKASVIAPRRTVEAGDWAPRADEWGSRAGFGLLLLDGFLSRRVSLRDRAAVELLGPGDLLQPWLDDGEFAVMPFEACSPCSSGQHSRCSIGRWPNKSAAGRRSSAIWSLAR